MKDIDELFLHRDQSYYSSLWKEKKNTASLLSLLENNKNFKVLICDLKNANYKNLSISSPSRI